MGATGLPLRPPPSGWPPPPSKPLGSTPGDPPGAWGSQRDSRESFCKGEPEPCRPEPRVCCPSGKTGLGTGQVMSKGPAEPEQGPPLLGPTGARA